jgi:hypothetical protein
MVNPAKRKHTIFVETKTTPKTSLFSTGTIPALAGRAFNRPRLETLKETALKAAGCGQKSGDDDGHKKADRKETTPVDATRP